MEKENVSLAEVAPEVEQLKAIFDDLSDSLVLLYPSKNNSGNISEFRISYINPSGSRMLKFPQKNIAGKTLSDFFPKAENKKLFHTCRKLVEEGTHSKINSYSLVLNTPKEKLTKQVNLSISKLGEGLSLRWAELQAPESKNTTVEELKGKLRKSEERFHMLAKGLAMFMFVWTADAEGNVDFRLGENWNEFRESVEDDGRGSKWQSGLHPDDVERTLKAWEHAVSTGEDYENLQRMRRNDGEYRWRVTRAKAMKDPSGKIIKWYGTSTDVHDQKILEDKLKETLNELKRNQLRFERAESLAHVGSWLLNVETGEMEISDGLTRIFGIDPERIHITAGEYLSFVHPDDVEGLYETSARHHKEKKTLDIEYRVILADGKLRYIHALSDSEEIEGESIRYGAVKDITDRKNTELALVRERELFESIINSIPVMITIYDPEFQRFKFNEEITNILGYTEEDASDGRFMEKICPESNYRKEVAGFMQSLEPCWKELRLTAKNGIQVESSWYNIRLPDGTQIGIGIDITESKLSESRLKKTLEELERSNRELEQFAYIASHDLQEPLRIVSSFAKLLSQRYKGSIDEKAEQYIDFMVDGTKRMQNLIHDLLMYARVTTKAQPLVPTDLNDIMDYVLMDLRMAIAEKKANISCDKLPEVNADPVQTRQLLQNLISNAIKFHEANDPEVYIKAERKLNDWVFSVRDNGIGIDPRFHERIFVIFQRLHEREKYTGTGIGLAICKKIVDRHGGRIWVESEEGKGSTFYFTIPAGNA